ncbi:MAG: GNAT family N-acetyltransferase [Elusimicrobiales bacterium]|nr:GNAT family N-acetyltransferase [Elusimicrobiales bacterium]
MKIWLVTIGEPVPIDSTNKERLHRTGALANYLVEKGHQVVWWTSTFDHFKKKHLFQTHTSVKLENGLDIRLIHGTGYSKNISFSRIWDHKQISFTFYNWIRQETELPDIILAAFPTIELASMCVDYGNERGIPVLVDVRDLWPDIFAEVLPPVLKGFAKLALTPMNTLAVMTLKRSTGIIGISEWYLKWALRKAGLEQRIPDAVFPLGYKPGVSTPSELQKTEKELRDNGVDPAKFICWFVGAFGKTYDLAPVILAAKKLSLMGHDNIQFVFSGSGDKTRLWQKMAEGVPNIVFTGWVNAAKIEFLGRSAKLGLAAYASKAPQSLPNKLFEYFSFGLPVLSSLEGEAKELLRSEHCGYSYDVLSSADLYKTILDLMSNEPERLSAAARAKKLFNTKFSADVIYPHLLAHIETVALRAQREPVRLVPFDEVLRRHHEGPQASNVCFVAYSSEGSEYDPVLAEELEFVWWRPRGFSVMPPTFGVRGFVWWLFLKCGIFINQDYAVLYIKHGNRFIHRSVILPGYFRWPFMAKEDLQISSTWTDPAYRGEKLATSALQKIVSELRKSNRRFWYVSRDSNPPSIVVAKKAGFRLKAYALRTRRFGIYLMGRLLLLPIRQTAE